MIGDKNYGTPTTIATIIPVMLRYEFQRYRRLLWPARYDHAAYMLVGAVGRYWLFLTGWRREYPVGHLYIDLAHPWLKLALEADGERWHRDIVHEMERDELLADLGWSTRHYRYPVLKDQPKRVKREVRNWFYRALLFNFRR